MSREDEIGADAKRVADAYSDAMEAVHEAIGALKDFRENRESDDLSALAKSY